MEAVTVPEFRGHLFAGERDLGEVSGSYAEREDGRWEGDLYAPDPIPVAELLPREDLVLEVAAGEAHRIELLRETAPGGRGQVVAFVWHGPPLRQPWGRPKPLAGRPTCGALRREGHRASGVEGEADRPACALGSGRLRTAGKDG